MTRLLFALYLIEAGLLLVVSPWTSWWSRNYFAELSPLVAWVLETEGARLVAITTGVGTALMGVTDLHQLLFRRISGRPARLDDIRDR